MQNRHYFKRNLQFLAAAVCLSTLLSLVGIGCPIRFLTGIPCAGCGMTRSWFLLLQFDIAGAFAMHPLFFTVPALLFFFLFGERFSRRTVSVFWIGTGILYAAVYLIRLAAGDPVLTPKLSDGFLFRSLTKFIF